MPDASRGASHSRRPARSGRLALDDLPIRDDLRGLAPYRGSQAPAAIRLNSNENPHPMPSEVAEAIEKAVGTQVAALRRYPDQDAVALREDLAAYLNGDEARSEDVTPAGLGLTAAHIWAANGSNEAQQQILQTFGGPGRVAMGFAPSYSMHRLLALGTATGWIDGARDGDFRLSPQQAAAQVRASRPDLVFVCSPNNPTGGALPPDVLDAILAAAPGMVVVDEAYAEFRRDGAPSALRRLPDWPRLIVTRTMSKAFGCAGVRLGYLAAAPAVVDAMQLVRLPYHLSSLTQAAARAALAHAPRLLAAVDVVRRDRERLAAALRARGLTVADSDANFMLFGGFGAPAPEVWRRLRDRGVLIRDVGLAGWLRVTVGTSEENAAFLRALDEALGGARAPDGAGAAGSASGGIPSGVAIPGGVA